MKYYIAYGSNLNMAQMEYRCPDAVYVGSGYLKDWELIYRGSKTGAYATIRPAKGKIVPIGLWSISRRDEASLDCYEGYPVFYHKKTLKVYGNDAVENGMAYIMDENRKVWRPSNHYIDIVYEGYMDCDLDGRFLLESLKTNWQELYGKRGRG